MSVVTILLLVYGVIATSVGFYLKGVERGRQISEEEGSARP